MSVKELIKKPGLSSRLKEILKDNAELFISSVIQLSETSNLKDCEPISVVNAAITSATLNLTLNQNLGYAYIVPYTVKEGNDYVKYAQFQLGWKGLVQLALRTGDYRKINAIAVYANQFKWFNTLTEDLAGDFHLKGEGEPIGYAAYFELTNGFTKTTFWTLDEVKAHANQYSKTYNKNNKYGKLMSSPWNNSFEFDSMAMKTVLKNALLKFGKLSFHMERAIQSDQSIQREEGNFEYPDNDGTDENGNTKLLLSSEELLQTIESCQSKDELELTFDEYKKEITKDIHLVNALGKKKKEFEV